MLYTQTIEAGTLDLIKELIKDKELDSFNLVGGTALSLKLGHRMSVDIDLFTDRNFDSLHLSRHLTKTYNTGNIKTLRNGIFCFINGIKVDMLTHQYPLLNKVEKVDGIRMLSLQDIGAMKLNAILHSGTRLKDFMDMHFLLEQLPLQKITEGFVQKYPDVNVQMAHNALLYFNDFNKEEKISFLVREISLKEMKIRLKSAVANTNLVFKPDQPKKLPSIKNNLRPNVSRQRKHRKRPGL
ncbi:MAG: nucleotidyl transferase AbiEii/AbiGii toxin family protein [Ginsengibacter sp.]